MEQDICKDDIGYITTDYNGLPTAIWSLNCHGMKGERDYIPIEAITINDEDLRAFSTEHGKWLWKDNRRVLNTAYASFLENREREFLKARLTDAIQQYLDTTAKSIGYDHIISLCSYSTSTDPIFAAEGQAGLVWRDACWRHAAQVLAAVNNNERAIPTVEELIAELPQIQWPE